MMLDSSERLKEVGLSAIRKVVAEAKALERQGTSIIHMEIGEPDFHTPSAIISATKEALDQGFTHYGPNRGVLELRETIANDLGARLGLQYDPEKEIVVTVGAAEAIFDSIVAYLNPGDEAIILEPAFINYVHCTRLAGAVPVQVSLREEKGFQVDKGELRQAITPKTKLIVLNTPNNPTGTILTRESLQIIADVAQEHDLLVISDEIYERITYGSQHIAIASFPGMRERTITINGFSKAYAMTGWRLAYFAASEELILPILKMHQYVTTCAPTFVQVGLAKGMGRSDDDVMDMIKEFKRRRDFLVSALNSIPRLSCIEPQGAFYVFLNIKGLGINSEEAAKKLLYEAGVATVPGTAFGPSGEGNVRLSYATSYENIVKAVERIKKAFAS